MRLPEFAAWARPERAAEYSPAARRERESAVLELLGLGLEAWELAAQVAVQELAAVAELEPRRAATAEPASPEYSALRAGQAREAPVRALVALGSAAPVRPEREHLAEDSRLLLVALGRIRLRAAKVSAGAARRRRPV